MMKTKIGKVKKWILLVKEYLEDTKDEHVAAFSGQSAFFIFLSVFPLLNLILSLAPYLPFSEEEIVNTLIQVIPKDLSGYVRSIIGEIFEHGTPSVTIISFVVGIYSASKGVMAIRNGLNEIVRSRETRNIIIVYLVGMLNTLVTLVVILLVAFVTLFGRQVGESVIEHHAEFANLANFLMQIRGAVSFILMFAVILFMYTMMPHRKLLMRYQMVGAAFSAGAWVLISWGFSYYISYSMKKSYMYGSLSTIIMLLFWLYIMVNVIFLGAQINAFLYLNCFKEKADLIMEKKMEKRAKRRDHLRTKLLKLKPGKTEKPLTAIDKDDAMLENAMEDEDLSDDSLPGREGDGQEDTY